MRPSRLIFELFYAKVNINGILSPPKALSWRHNRIFPSLEDFVLSPLLSTLSSIWREILTL